MEKLVSHYPQHTKSQFLQVNVILIIRINMLAQQIQFNQILLEVGTTYVHKHALVSRSLLQLSMHNVTVKNDGGGGGGRGHLALKGDKPSHPPPIENMHISTYVRTYVLAYTTNLGCIGQQDD